MKHFVRKGMKILVPLDGSEHSQRALETALCIAHEFDGRITLIHVVSSVVPRYVLPSDAARDLEENRKAGADLLAKARKKVADEGIQVETLLETGHVVGQILNNCRKNECDLVIIGARGMSRLKELFLGSVTDGVTRHGDRPVLVVK